jgi:hypothetical protein
VHPSIGPDWTPFLTPSLRSNDIPFSLPIYITEPIPEPTHINPEDGGSMFLHKAESGYRDYTVSQYIRPQSEG